MATLLVKPKSKAEFKLLYELLKKMQITNKVLSNEELEDLGLIAMMKEVDKTQKVSRAKVMAKLGRT